MHDNRLITITKLFENKEIRSIWDAEREEYYFSVIDVIAALTNSRNPNNYWNMLKKRMSNEEKSELYTKCVQLKLKSKDGKLYRTDTLDIQGVFRLIESVPSPKAEPLKMWLATLGKERIDEVFDPEIAVNRAIEYYLKRGYPDDWIKSRLTGILDRKKLTDVWKEGGIENDYEYAILTNEIYKTWSGMSAKEYKEYKGLRKESLRDNMESIELILTDLGEESTKIIAKKVKPYGLEDNISIARKGGKASKIARDFLEEQTGEKVISSKKNLKEIK